MECYIEELKLIRKAILALTADPSSSQTVSSATGGSYSVTYQSLPSLYARERYLMAMIAEMGRDGGLGLSYPLYC